jgi:gliding motility-associated-like protein
VIVNSGTAPFKYLWDNNPAFASDTVAGLLAGNHTVQVTDLNGCTVEASVIIAISGICNDVYFPASFSPNGDNRNEFFGALGNVIGISNYRLQVFNRYGQQVFMSSNPLVKWGGTFNGKPASPGAYVWQVTYTYQGNRQQHRHGTVTIVR